MVGGGKSMKINGGGGGGGECRGAPAHRSCRGASRDAPLHPCTPAVAGAGGGFCSSCFWVGKFLIVRGTKLLHFEKGSSSFPPMLGCVLPHVIILSIRSPIASTSNSVLAMIVKHLHHGPISSLFILAVGLVMVSIGSAPASSYRSPLQH